MAIDVTNEQMKQGALDALQLIIQSKISPLKVEPSTGSESGSNNGQITLKLPHNIETPPQIADNDLENSNESSKEEQTRLERIKQSMNNEEVAADINEIETDTAYRNAASVQGKRDELNRIKQQDRVGDFSEFINDLYQAIKSQIGLSKNPEDTYTRVNPTYAGSDLLMPGQAQIDKREIPTVQIYFDQSGSWGEDEIHKGFEGLAALATFERRKKIKINPPLYFANHLHDEAIEAQMEGGTAGFGEVLADIQTKINSEHLNNVIILTDSDIDSQGSWKSNFPTTTVKGCVWWLWKTSGNKSKSGPKYLKGLKGNYFYSLY